jgi:hypothetical protein
MDLMYFYYSTKKCGYNIHRIQLRKSVRPITQTDAPDFMIDVDGFYDK